MNIAKLSKAIYDRAKTDSGSGGLFNAAGLLYPDKISGFYGDIDNPTTFGGYPFVVYMLSAEEGGDSAFTLDVQKVTLEFHIFDLRESGLANCETIIDRLRGNWSGSTPSTAPTYGFHHHTLDLATAGSSWTSTQFRCVGHDAAHDKDLFHFIEVYEGYQTK